MTILCHVAAQAATVNADKDHGLDTSMLPVYTAEPPIHRPDRLASHQQTEALAAIGHARRRYPGAAGAVLVEAIEAYKELGCLGQPSAPVARLIRDLMTPPGTA